MITIQNACGTIHPEILSFDILVAPESHLLPCCKPQWAACLCHTGETYSKYSVEISEQPLRWLWRVVACETVVTFQSHSNFLEVRALSVSSKGGGQKFLLDPGGVLVPLVAFAWVALGWVASMALLEKLSNHALLAPCSPPLVENVECKPCVSLYFAGCRTEQVECHH